MILMGASGCWLLYCSLASCVPCRMLSPQKARFPLREASTPIAIGWAVGCFPQPATAKQARVPNANSPFLMYFIDFMIDPFLLLLTCPEQRHPANGGTFC